MAILPEQEETRIELLNGCISITQGNGEAERVIFIAIENVDRFVEIINEVAEEK